MASSSHLCLRIIVGGNDVELIAPNGARYDVLVVDDGWLVLIPVAPAIEQESE